MPELPPRRCTSCGDTAPLVARIGGRLLVCQSCRETVDWFHRWLSTSAGRQPNRRNRPGR